MNLIESHHLWKCQKNKPPKDKSEKSHAFSTNEIKQCREKIKDDLNKSSGGFNFFLLFGISWHIDELDSWW